LLEITADGVQQRLPSNIHFEESYGFTESVDPGEAFEFLHGDYSPHRTYMCAGCGATHHGEDVCDCPLGSSLSSIEWPDIPTRSPRRVERGELLTCSK
jgi:hypothetical protein